MAGLSAETPQHRCACSQILVSTYASALRTQSSFHKRLILELDKIKYKMSSDILCQEGDRAHKMTGTCQKRHTEAA